MGTNEIIKLAVSGVAAAFLFVLRSFFAGKNPKDGTGKKKNKKKTLDKTKNINYNKDNKTTERKKQEDSPMGR